MRLEWSVASDRNGIPIGWPIDGANRNDGRMLEPSSTPLRTSAYSSTSAPCTSTAATTQETAPPTRPALNRRTNQLLARQLRRNTERRAALCLASTPIIGRLLDYRTDGAPPKHLSAQIHS